ncbi:conserved hypothetical protein [Paecilomyces variotii No. 5]|uniref:Gamma-butyrobetaine hydroxylase subfamily n=1 Tax=Byssochlamys spectabilis (strain No. 5 / NBRC 109023) TaxID=1356009 RepID=V5I538_BYSSN|nr:conserved hypothetical protein [Paecilomyces variotii No. 5]
MSRSLTAFLRPARRPSGRIQCYSPGPIVRRSIQQSTPGRAAQLNEHRPGEPDVPVRKSPSGRDFPLDTGFISRITIPQLEGDAPDGVSAAPGSLRVLVQGKDGEKISKGVDYAMLRDACSCERCVDPHSKQRSFRTSDIPAYITPRSVKRNGDQLEIQWRDDIPGYDESHTSTYPEEFLRSPASYSLGSATAGRRRTFWDREYMQRAQHWISYEDYVNDDARFATAMRKLAKLGLIFVKDIPDSREMVERIATRMGPLRNSFYGLTWDVRTVPQAKNVAYTNQFLGFHMDLMYMKDPPGFQLLHCLKNSCDGGESLFADAFGAAARLYTKDTRAAQLLREFPLNYEYIHKDQMYHNSWPVIETESPERISPSHFRHINYSPPFQGPFRRPKGITTNEWGKKFRHFREALAAFTKELENEQAIFQLKLNPGECVIFENRRVVHARRAFNTTSGERWLAGAYVDEDAVLSRFRVCKATQPDAWHYKETPADGE